MPVYNITETKHAIMRWEFTVVAEDEDEALRMVQNGKVDPESYFVDEDPFESSDYEVEEAK